MLHASTVWTSCSVKNIQKVFRLQKHTARLILGADTKGNSVKLNKPILVYKRIPGQCPPYLADACKKRRREWNIEQAWSSKPFCPFLPPIQTGD